MGISHMKKMIISIICLILFLVSLAWGREKVEAPTINVGSKWFLRTDTGQEWRLEAIGEENGKYILLKSISEGLYKGEWKQFYDKKTMNCVKVLNGEGREDLESKGFIKKYYDFPLYSGKKWNYIYTSMHGMGSNKFVDILSRFLVVGFGEVNVTAGRFRAVKVQNEQNALGGCHCQSKSYRKNYFWYSPDAKTILKFERDPNGYRLGAEYMKYELISFELK